MLLEKNLPHQIRQSSCLKTHFYPLQTDRYRFYKLLVSFSIRVSLWVIFANQFLNHFDQFPHAIRCKKNNAIFQYF